MRDPQKQSHKLKSQTKMFLLECLRCKNRMKYAPLRKQLSAAAAAAENLDKKVKKCVYCNFSMNVQKSVVQKL